jgi:hypothetical protein
LDAECFKLACAGEEFYQERDILRAVCHPTAALFSAFGCVPGGLLVRKHATMCALDT